MVRSQLLVECSKYTTDEERLSHRPDDVMLEDWVFLVGLFGSEKLKVVSERNKINRGKKLTKHSCGPKSFAEVEESTRDPNTGNKTAPDQIWELQHTHKNNEGKQIQLQELVAQQQSKENTHPMNSDEILATVLGE